MNKSVVEELNQFLEGNLMAIHAYENYILHMEDEEIKQILQNMQKEHKQHAMMVAERIQNLNGLPVNDLGIKGTIAQLVQNVTETTHGTEHILKDALVGETRGMEMSKKLLEGDLDKESLALVKNILAHDEEHIKQLNELLH